MGLRKCCQCSASYWPKHSTSMYCTKACKLRAFKASRGIVSLSRAERSELTARRQAARRQSVQFQRDLVSVLAAIDCLVRMASRPTYPCKCCGAAVSKRWIDGSKTCSDRCSAEWKRIKKRTEKQRSRALLRKAKVENFTDLEIFERDRWRCHLCGCRTPRRSVGTNAAHAPTIDHVIALANGGAHARWNVRCACRQCNSLKAHHGQIGLL